MITSLSRNLRTISSTSLTKAIVDMKKRNIRRKIGVLKSRKEEKVVRAKDSITKRLRSANGSMLSGRSSARGSRQNKCHFFPKNV